MAGIGFFRQLKTARQRGELDVDVDEALLAVSPVAAAGGPRDRRDEARRAVTGGYNREITRAATEKPAEIFFYDQVMTLDFVENFWVVVKLDYMRSKKSNIDVDTFIKLMFQTLHACFPVGSKIYSEDSTRRHLELLFDRVDRKKSNSLKTTDIATALVLLCKTPPLEKLRLLFRIFDADDDSCLTPDEIFDMYYSIRKNDTSRGVSDLLADLVFDDELSLQAARRLYERTVACIRNISDFVIFDEFAQVFAKSPEILEQLVPGTFSMGWNMTEYRPSKVNPCSPVLVKEIRDSYKRTLRRGCEGLKLDKVSGRGTRILQTIREMPIHWAQPVQPVDARPVAPLPRLVLAKPEHSRDDEDMADEEEDDDEVRAVSVLPVVAEQKKGRTAEAVLAKQSALSGLAEELKEPELPLMSINYPDGQTFRSLKYDHTQQTTAVALTRRKQYNCVVCGIPHWFGDERKKTDDKKKLERSARPGKNA